MKLAVIFAVGWIFLELQAILYHRYWAKNLSVRLFFVQKAAVEGETGQLKEVITNRKFLPLPVLHVKFQMGRHLVFTGAGNFKITDQNYRSDIFSCMPWQEIRRTLDFDCKKRGYYQIRSADLISYDLFFLNHCVASLPAEACMYVYPGPADPMRLELPLKNLLGQVLARRALLLDPFEIQSVRPYQSFDPYKSINWKATAHTGELKVNVYTPASSWRVTLLLDTESDLLLADEDLTEEAIRLCGSIAEKMIEQGVPVAVFSNGRDCLTGLPSRLEAGAGKDHLRSVMELLARVQISAGDLGAHGSPRRPGVSSKHSGREADPRSGKAASLLSPAPNPQENNGAKTAGQPEHFSMEDLLFLMADPKSGGFGSDSSLYVMISPGQRASLSQAFDGLCSQSPGSQWILPKRPGDPLRIGQPRFAEIYEWEVPYVYT